MTQNQPPDNKGASGPAFRAASAFGATAADYDQARRKLIPPFDEFYGAALALLQDFGLAAGMRVLDLGAGTGLLSHLAANAFPGVEFHLLDGTPAMLEAAKKRLGSIPGISFELGDMAEASLGGPWNAVTSALAIHHLEDKDKRALFRRVKDALEPGGWFINAEQTLGPDPETDARYRRLWRKQIKALGATEEEIAQADQRMAFDLCAPVADQLCWMTEAGFQEVDVIFKSWRFAVMVGRAPL